ncbi:hypothetical protein BAE44_0013743, partial [Dichanthelium oligosanthes]
LGMLYLGHHFRSTGRRSSSSNSKRQQQRRVKLVQPNEGSSLCPVAVLLMDRSEC